ncbi:hypothetical protein N9L18_00335 [Candidatus Pacebacteria bacterium]|nr:hypothetical protein [Candidatus Paceibacterota bacterium]
MKFPIKILLIVFLLSPSVSFAADSDLFIYPTGDGEYDRTEEIYLAVEQKNLTIRFDKGADIYVDDGKDQHIISSNVDIESAIYTTIHIPINLLEVSIFGWKQNEEKEYFNIFVCEHGKECSFQDRSVRENIIGATSIKVNRPKDDLELVLTVNGKRDSLKVGWGDKIKVKWEGDSRFQSCSGDGHFMPDDEGGIWPDDSPRDFRNESGLNVPYYSNLGIKGEATLFAKTKNGTNKAKVAIQCFPEDRNYFSVSEEVTVYISDDKSKKEDEHNSRFEEHTKKQEHGIDNAQKLEIVKEVFGVDSEVYQLVELLIVLGII